MLETLFATILSWLYTKLVTVIEKHIFCLAISFFSFFFNPKTSKFLTLFIDITAYKKVHFWLFFQRTRLYLKKIVQKLLKITGNISKMSLFQFSRLKNFYRASYDLNSMTTGCYLLAHHVWLFKLCQ